VGLLPCKKTIKQGLKGPFLLKREKGLLKVKKSFLSDKKDFSLDKK